MYSMWVTGTEYMSCCDHSIPVLSCSQKHQCLDIFMLLCNYSVTWWHWLLSWEKLDQFQKWQISSRIYLIQIYWQRIRDGKDTKPDRLGSALTEITFSLIVSNEWIINLPFLRTNEQKVICMRLVCLTINIKSYFLERQTWQHNPVIQNSFQNKDLWGKQVMEFKAE